MDAIRRVSLAGSRVPVPGLTPQRSEGVDRTLFWAAADLEAKLRDFQRYYTETLGSELGVWAGVAPAAHAR